MRIYVRTFGQFAITEFGRPIEPPRAKEKALIAFLTLNQNKMFRRAYLADLLWDGPSEGRSRHSLNQALYSIRRMLPAILSFQGDAIGITEKQIQTDVADLHAMIDGLQIREVLSALERSFLEGLVIHNAPQFEEWRCEYEMSFRRIVDDRMHIAVGSLGRFERDSLLRDISVDLLKSLPATAKAFGLEHGVMQRQQGVVLGLTARDEAHQTIGLLPFIGRDAEIRRLTSSWNGAKNGTACFVLIKGLPGLGKTRLAQEFAAEAEGARVLNIKCYESERRIAFCSVGTLLMSEISKNEINSLDERWQRAITQLMPSIEAANSISSLKGSAVGQVQLFEGIRRLLIQVCKHHPVMLLVDDVQWADPSTRGLLCYLSHRSKHLPIMMVATFRAKDHSAPPEFQHWDVVDLEELDTSSVSTITSFVRSAHDIALPSDGDIIRITRGHPYLLSSFLQSIIAGKAPTAVRDGDTLNVDAFVGSLIRALPRRSQLTLAALAVLGHPASVHTLRHIVQAPRLEQHLDLLVNRGLVDFNGSEVALRHDLVREATYKRIPIFTRGELHRRAGRVLARDSRRAGETAEHFYRSGNRKLAYKSALKAADEADVRHAYQESITFLKLAVKCRREVDSTLRARLADRLHRVSRVAEARQEVQKAIESNTSVEMAAELSITELELGYALGEFKGESLRTTMNMLRSDRNDLNAYQIFRILRLKLRSGHHEANKAVAEEAIRELREFALSTSSPVKVEAMAFAARAHSFLTSASEAEQWLQPFLQQINSTEDPSIRLTAIALMAANYYDVGKLADAERALTHVLEETERTGMFSEWPLHASYLHMIYIEQGKYNQALDLRSSVLTRVIPEQIRHFTAPFASNETMMYYEIGDFDRAEAAALETMQHVSNIRSIWLEISTLGLLGLIYLEKGKLSKAEECSRRLQEHLDRRPYLAGDVSYIQIFLSRIALLHNRMNEAIDRLKSTIQVYQDRDLVCRLRMQLELARVLKARDRQGAREYAKYVYEVASEINARPIADRADGLLLRL